MDLSLTFANGSISGEGIDAIGRFNIKGRYDTENRECYWTKTYLGAHDVFYRGFREGKGIWGTWETGPHWHGGFHIWPRQEGDLEQVAASVPAEISGEERVEAVGVAVGETQGSEK